jgi:hypothetical protein
MGPHAVYAVYAGAGHFKQQQFHRPNRPHRPHNQTTCGICGLCVGRAFRYSSSSELIGVPS